MAKPLPAQSREMERSAVVPVNDVFFKSCWLNVQQVNERLNTCCHSLVNELGAIQIYNAWLLRAKAKRRYLIVYEGHDSIGVPICLVGKVRVKGLDLRTHQNCEALWLAGFDDQGHTCIPRPWGIIPEWNMTIQAFSYGSPVRLGQNDHLEPHRQIADSLMRLHAVNLGIDRQHDSWDEYQILETKLVPLQNTAPQWSTAIAEVLRRAKGIAAARQSDPTGIIHRDFYFDQVLIQPHGGVALLDLDLLCRGPLGLDVGNYAAHLLEYGLRNTSCALWCRDAEMLFTGRYLSQSTVSCEQLSDWKFLALARHIALSQQFANRMHTTEPLIELLLNYS